MCRISSFLSLIFITYLALAGGASSARQDELSVTAGGAIDALAARPRLIKYQVTNCTALAATIQTINGIMANATSNQRFKVELACRRSSFTDCDSAMMFKWVNATSPPPSLELEISAESGCRAGRRRPSLASAGGVVGAFFYAVAPLMGRGAAGFALTLRGLRFANIGDNSVVLMQAASASNYGRRTITLQAIDVSNGTIAAVSLAYADEIKIKQCRFEGFQGVDVYNAMYISNPQGAVLIEKTAFENIATNGGGMTIAASQGNKTLPLVDVRSCTFSNCASTATWGNAVTMRYAGNATLVMTRNKFIETNSSGLPVVCFKDEGAPITDPAVTSRSNRGLGSFGVPALPQECTYVAMQQ